MPLDKKDLKQIKDLMFDVMEPFIRVIKGRFDNVDKKFDKMDEKFGDFRPAEKVKELRKQLVQPVSKTAEFHAQP